MSVRRRNASTLQLAQRRFQKPQPSDAETHTDERRLFLTPRSCSFAIEAAATMEAMPTEQRRCDAVWCESENGTNGRWMALYPCLLRMVSRSSKKNGLRMDSEASFGASNCLHLSARILQQQLLAGNMVVDIQDNTRFPSRQLSAWRIIHRLLSRIVSYTCMLCWIRSGGKCWLSAEGRMEMEVAIFRVIDKHILSKCSPVPRKIGTN